MGEIGIDVHGNAYWKPQSQMLGEYMIAKMETAARKAKRAARREAKATASEGTV